MHTKFGDRACRRTQDNDDSAQYGSLILTILAKPPLYNPNCSEPGTTSKLVFLWQVATGVR